MNLKNHNFALLFHEAISIMTTNKKFNINLGLILVFFTLLAGCSTKNKFDIDVSSIKINLNIQRFDKDLFGLNHDSIDEAIPKFNAQYGAFFEMYNNKIITIGSSNQRAYPDYLKGFLSDYTINEVNKKCTEIFPNVNDLQARLTDAFKHYKYYFPNKAIPSIYTYISGFNQSIVTADKILGIGLDKYLGSKCDFYKRLNLPVFATNKMYKERIPSDCMIAWAYCEFPYNTETDNLINQMIYQGKVMYFEDAMLPNEHDSLKFGFTTAQLKWCTASEKDMWIYLIEKKQLFISDFLSLKKYMDDSPFTPNFSRKSPARACVWLGRQIVRSYMKKNSKITLEMLMADNNYQMIFSKAKYKP